jgi:hypothetical protein
MIVVGKEEEKDRDYYLRKDESAKEHGVKRHSLVKQIDRTEMRFYSDAIVKYMDVDAYVASHLSIEALAPKGEKNPKTLGIISSTYVPADDFLEFAEELKTQQ